MVKKKKKKRAQLPFRLNILFFVVFLSFSVLILQLGVVQILNGDSFQEEIERTIEDTSKVPVPRGKIYDSNHDVVVDNKAQYSITYTPNKGVQAKDRLKVAETLAEFISMDTDGITERNRQEYWYLKNKDEADSRVSDEEAEEMGNTEFYDMVLDRISEDEINNFSEEEEEVIAIKKELDKAQSLTPQIVKNEDVTSEEYARVAEHLDVLPGVNATTDWNREYPYDDTFRNLIGSITSQEEGIPGDQEDYYVTRGYSRNDRVGKNGLEEQYEDVLRGTKEQIRYSTDKGGNVVNTETVVEGERGKDVVLTIDMEFQERVDEIVREELDKAISEAPYENRNMEDALAVVMDPQTGELLAVSGQSYDREENEFNNTASKALYDAHRPGSIIKGATMLAGYESEVITPGQTFYDAPIKIAGTEEKASWKNLGLVNDLNALQQSSNVYMFNIAMRMGGEYNYQRNETVAFDSGAWQEMRNYFRQFGLGSETGIDFPFESTGYVGSQGNAGNFMDYAIGQFDTYTTMQMAQYVATIANDGYRVRPHFLKEIRNPVASEDNLGSLYHHQNTDVLNRIQMDQDKIERVQEGFRQVFQTSNGTGYSYFGSKNYNPAGKTGTAENEVYDEDGGGVEQYTENLSLVGYAPFDEPEIAFAVIVPNTGDASGINHYIGEGILDTYFDLKEDRSESDEEENEDE
ncbi:peptidoglycan D,D-transpeptidase FtsI family protein [Virgibacillus sp. CBA3643]|uniref:peptidoglycan D,D-transpeptidase FtsI family protein n=1 Tax=Virgibacillus sp. CBA3643 TaxID=2942278 RepID=UPI0035A2B1B1